ncbi:hypothetical protein Dvina_02445 [Dactylosporangium vinaceum]|uniref:WD40 repeat protein n=1 Tax=Dactylosporangium vinaceum TaxID=53362 RepID=A0ABV5MFF8_9ACTN|nr:hypothetical protein [Dactylosporangium vinaceum]UAB97090.1 hypothetical protein Dvina_02445 [Dactylosporangium vinaceum]
MRFEELLRDTVDEMGAELRSVPPGLAPSAMAEGRRIRVRRRVAVTVAALSAVVAALLPAVLSTGPDERPQPPLDATAVPSDRPGPSLPQAGPSAGPSVNVTGVLPGGWRVMAAGDLALRASGSYWPMGLPTPLTQVAPAGYRYLTRLNTQAPLQIADVDGEHAVSVDQRWGNGVYHWSPTGDRVVTSWTPKDDVSGFMVIEARTGNTTGTSVDRATYDCGRCDYAFTRTGTEVVVALADRTAGVGVERLTRGLQFFDALTGAPTRTLLAPGIQVPDSPFAFSPDGRFLITQSTTLSAGSVLVNLTTGETKPFPFAAVWVTDDQLVAPAGTVVMILRPDGTVAGELTPAVAGVPIVLGPPA